MQFDVRMKLHEVAWSYFQFVMEMLRVQTLGMLKASVFQGIPAGQQPLLQALFTGHEIRRAPTI